MVDTLNDLPQEHKERLLSHFYTKLEQVIRDNNLMRYNEPTNSLYDVYKMVAKAAETMMIPTNIKTTYDLEEYNILQHNHTQNMLILAYVQEHFDKLVG